MSYIMTERELALWDRSRSLANFHIHAVAMQIARIKDACERLDDEIALALDDQFVLRPIAEFQFLCVSLVRLRRAAVLAATIPSIKREIRAAIAAYDAAIPRLGTLRNVAEHFDDYVLQRGRDKSLTATEFSASLQVLSFSDTGVNWFDIELKFDDCLAVAEALFQAIKKARG